MKTNATLKGKRCRCSACKECFSVAANFDKHRKGVHGVDRACVDPATVGLVIRELAGNTFWSMPGEKELAEVSAQ